MSRIRRNVAKRKLDKLLRSADDESFFIMIWAVHAAQTGRPDYARPFLEFPDEVATDDISSRWAIHPWKCETMLNELLSTSKPVQPRGRTLNCQHFDALVNVANRLTKLESVEDGMVLKRINVLQELHRLAQRQFEWQRGLLTKTLLYRAAFIYGGEETSAFFARKNGFTLNEFSLASFAIRAQLHEKPAFDRTADMGQIGISPEKWGAIIDLLAIDHTEARRHAASLRADGGHTAYKKSLFREYPCVRFGPDGFRVHGPLPDLVTLRASSGVFYDVVNGSGDVKNEISERFETYCGELLRLTLNTNRVRQSFKYELRKGHGLESPDILFVNAAGDISTIFECKARRLSYEARYSENPISEARDAYDEMVKAVYQIWRFAAHLRLGHVPNERLAADARGVVLTLDTWMSFASKMIEEVLALAKERAQQDPSIIEADLIPVVFCPVDDLEQTLDRANETTLVDTIRAATTDDYRGWALWGVHQELYPDAREDDRFPFDDRMAEVLPWWDEVERRRS